MTILLAPWSRHNKLVRSQEFYVMDININENDISGTEEAVTLAQHSDVVIMVLSEHGMQTGEGSPGSTLS